MPAPIVFAHRGAAAEEPENTLPSFRRALELGADALETDVHLSADGHVVVSHDADGRRCAGVARSIASSTLPEIRTWDAGYAFVDALGLRPFVGRGYRFPTLEELLGELPDVRINVDLKSRAPALVDRFLEVVRSAGAEGRVVAASFFRAPLDRLRARGFAGQCGLSRAEVLGALFAPARLWRRPRGHRAQVPVRAGPFSLGSSRVVDRLHEIGLAVDFWTVNDPALARRLVGFGADGIMTDDPAKIVPALRESGEASQPDETC